MLGKYVQKINIAKTYFVIRKKVANLWKSIELVIHNMLGPRPQYAAIAQKTEYQLRRLTRSNTAPRQGTAITFYYNIVSAKYSWAIYSRYSPSILLFSYKD